MAEVVYKAIVLGRWLSHFLYVCVFGFYLKNEIVTCEEHNSRVNRDNRVDF